MTKVWASIPEDVCILGGVLFSEGVMYKSSVDRLQWSWDLKMCPY